MVKLLLYFVGLNGSFCRMYMLVIFSNFKFILGKILKKMVFFIELEDFCLLKLEIKMFYFCGLLSIV